MKKTYVVLCWSSCEGFYGVPCMEIDNPSKTFIGTKKEAKDLRDYMRDTHPKAKYKIAGYPFSIEGHDMAVWETKHKKRKKCKWWSSPF